MPTKPDGQLEPTNRLLSDYLCFAVYSANLAFGKAYRPILKELGLTYTQSITLTALRETDNQTVSELGDKLFLESNTLTPILKKLEAIGYLLRLRDPEDECQVRISLTENGRRLHEQGPKMDLEGAMKLDPYGFDELQKAMVALRGSLIDLAENSK
ncbi:MAG TPA: MarR family transcriptional regulator [Paraburkholderia sp.]